MEIRTEQEGKWISPMYGKFLTQSSATKDEDRVVAKQVYIPLDESNDEWTEITKEDAERIFKAKKAARGQIEYPEEQVNQMIGLFASQINTMNLTDEQALQFKNLYPAWENFISQKLEKDYKVLYQDRLYKVKQTIKMYWKTNRLVLIRQHCTKKSTKPMPGQKKILFRTITTWSYLKESITPRMVSRTNVPEIPDRPYIRTCPDL